MTLLPALLKILKEVKGITFDSRKVEEGFLFFAIKGSAHDGHDFVGEALKKGAVVAVVERDLPFDNLIKVEDTKKALGESASIFFGKPSGKLKIVGVTGTNGKTTTTYLIEKVLNIAGYKAGLLGTIHYRLGEEILGSGRTTPDQITWHRTLKEMLDLGATHAVSEVSSHALDQERIWGTEFEAVIFTNLTQDHLDYHGDMESYFRAKEKLFLDYNYRFAVINADDPYGKRLSEKVGDRAITYGRNGNLKIKEFETGFGGSRLTLEYRGKTYGLYSNLIGDFQAYNLSAAVGYALGAGIDMEAVREALKDVHVPGRFEVYRSEKGFLVVVDYAHTPDAMDNVLRTVRKLAKGRVITVFGAGGDRDRSKRPLMGAIAEKWSDFVVVTSDNPRSEDPLRIIEDILEGIRDKDRAIVEPDRREAIGKAVSLAKEGDIVAVLGKGHEDYQEVKGVKYPFSDSEVVKAEITEIPSSAPP